MTENLRALGRMAPGRTLGRTAAPELQKLLDEVVALPEMEDPLAWLRAERRDAVARALMKRVILLLKYEEEHLRARRTDLPPQMRELDDAWRYRSGSADVAYLFEDFGDTSQPDAARMASILRRVRHVRPAYVRDGYPPPAGDLPRLINDLLRLADHVDPVDWMRRERTELAVVLLAADLLAVAFRDATAPGEDVASSELSGELHVGRLVISRPTLVVGTNGFTLRVEVHLDCGRLPGVDGDEPLCYWEGFDSVSDNLGFRYPVLSSNHEGLLSGHTSNFAVYIRCWPALASDANALVLRSSPAVLVVQAIGVDATLRQLPDVSLGDISWHLSIPKSVSVDGG